jgi:Family of unknown function (DUF5715)
MTQWGHAPTDDGARANQAARTAIWITVWSVVIAFAMFCAVSQALAETYTPHARRVTARYTTAHFVTHHTRARATGVRAGRTTARGVSVEGSRRARSRAPKFEPVKEPASSRRTSAGERRSARDAQPALPSMHRVSSRRRRGERRAGSERLDVIAGTNAHAADSSVQARLSVDDVVSASGAHAPGSGVYANGVAHPDENVSAPSASVEASTAQRESAPLQRSAPSDLVGAPLTTQARPEPRATATVSGMSLATREDLAEEAAQPVVLPGLYRYGRLVVPPPMRGTREILVHQNLIADEEGLSRIQDDDDLRRMRGERMLVDFPESMSLHVNAELAGDRRCARPWTVRFAGDIARAYYLRFHQPLQVNSAVRTVAYQVRLRRTNGNAAGIGGEMASPHLTGEAIDFGKRDMTTEEIAWMRTYLRPLMQVGKVDVEEEFQQACFHISVYRSYAPAMALSRREYAEVGSPHVTRARADVDQ